VVLGLKAMTLGTLVLTLYPMDVIFARFPPMTMLQFPWRFMAIATFGASALAGFAVLRLIEAFDGKVWSRFIPAAIIGLMVFDFFPYQGAALSQKPYEGIYRLSGRNIPDPLPLRVDHLSYPPSSVETDLSLLRRVYPEYFTRLTRRKFKNAKKNKALERVCVGMSFKKGRHKLHPAPYAEFFPATGRHSRALDFTRAGERIRVDLPREKGRLEIKEQWFPGWILSLGNVHREVESTKDGLMKVDLEASDKGALTLHFSRTRWDRLGGILLSLFTLLALFIPWRPRARVES